MKRGRKPKPTVLKILEGNPSKRPLPPNEPRPEVGPPTIPKHYRGDAKRYWNCISKQLASCGLLTRIDGAALELLVDALIEYRESALEVARTGPVWLSNDSDPIPKFAYSPYWCMMNRASKKLHLMLREFGMTPSSRSSIKSAAPLVDAAEDPVARYFS